MESFGSIRNVAAEIKAELDSLDNSYPHASRLLKEGMVQSYMRMLDPPRVQKVDFFLLLFSEYEKVLKEENEKSQVESNGNARLTHKIYINQFNGSSPKVPIVSSCCFCCDYLNVVISRHT